MVSSALDEKLDSINHQLADFLIEIKEIKQSLNNLSNTEIEDISAAYNYNDIEMLKKRVNDLELKLKEINSANS